MPSPLDRAIAAGRALSDALHDLQDALDATLPAPSPTIDRAVQRLQHHSFKLNSNLQRLKETQP